MWSKNSGISLEESRNLQKTGFLSRIRVLYSQRAKPVQIDEQMRSIILPRDNIANIRVLPDGFDMNNITVITEGNTLGINVDDAPTAWIGEFGEF